ncbi:MAG: type II toxin-antitoxin system Phd/YefM family antitoxin [Acidimicrobiales bacterium]
MPTLTISALRADIYRIIDRVVQTGQPVEVTRKGRRVRIVPVDPPSRLDNLTPHPDAIVGDPEDLVHMDWFDEWRP